MSVNELIQSSECQGDIFQCNMGVLGDIPSEGTTGLVEGADTPIEAAAVII